MAFSNIELNIKLKDVAEKFAAKWTYENVVKEKNNLRDNLYSDCEFEDDAFWQAHLTFLECHADEKGEYVLLSVDISDNRGKVTGEGSAYRPMTAGLVIYQNGAHEIHM